MSRRRILHIEIPANTPPDAAKFYSEIFGWETTVTQPYDYTTFKSGSIGGAFPRIGEYYQANDVLVYIESDDVDADIAKIKAMGGQQVGEKFEIPGEGCQIRFIDPSGNHLALWQSYKDND